MCSIVSVLLLCCVHDELCFVVRLAVCMMSSIVCMIVVLQVLGMSFLMGGYYYPTQKFNKSVSTPLAASSLCVCLSFCLDLLVPPQPALTASVSSLSLVPMKSKELKTKIYSHAHSLILSHCSLSPLTAP